MGWGGNKMRDLDMATGKMLNTNKIENPEGHACLDLSGQIHA